MILNSSSQFLDIFKSEYSYMSTKWFPVMGNRINPDQYRRIDLSIHSKFQILAHKSAWMLALEKHQDLDPNIFYFGGYLEERFFYLNEELFGTGVHRRKYHLGLDIWAKAGTDIYCPLDGEIRYLQNNANHLDYGHTIIIKHELATGECFHTLYGHLSSDHILKLKVGDHISAGQRLCSLGDYDENGGWPPHIHFQIIKDLGDNVGDYPGVASENDISFYRVNCPDPTTFVIP